MLWDLADLASAGELAARFGVRPGTVVTWANRYPEFPAPLCTLGGVEVYSIEQVTRWESTRKWGNANHR